MFSFISVFFRVTFGACIVFLFPSLRSIALRNRSFTVHLGRVGVGKKKRCGVMSPTSTEIRLCDSDAVTQPRLAQGSDSYVACSQ